VTLLAERDLDELRSLADAGDRFAAGDLAALLRERGDLDGAGQVLRSLADAGDPYAAGQLARLLYERGDRDGTEQVLRASIPRPNGNYLAQSQPTNPVSGRAQPAPDGLTEPSCRSHLGVGNLRVQCGLDWTQWACRASHRPPAGLRLPPLRLAGPRAALMASSADSSACTRSSRR
jgi:hypothetical protein